MKNLLLALSLAFATGLAFAETETAGDGSAAGKPRGEPPWFKEIGLTDEQRQEMRKIRQEGGSKEDVMSVLTPEQREKKDALKASRKGGGDGGLARMKRHLGLSDEQYAEMEKIRDEGGTREEMLEVLTPEQKEKLQTAEQRRKGNRPPPRTPGAPTEEAPPV